MNARRILYYRTVINRKNMCRYTVKIKIRITARGIRGVELFN